MEDLKRKPDNKEKKFTEEDMRVNLLAFYLDMRDGDMGKIKLEKAYKWINENVL